MSDTPKTESRVNTMRGVVVRRSGARTVTVQVTRVSRHPLYAKKVVRSKRYLADDPDEKAEVGSEVVLKESKPISKRKRWVVVYGS